MNEWKQLLTRRSFALWWGGQTISIWGDYIFRIALPLWVLGMTGSAQTTGIALAIGLLPFLASPWAGTLVDRWDPRRTVIACDLARATCVGLLALFGHIAPIYFIYLLSFSLNLMTVLFIPARNAVLVRLVEKEDLVPANSMTSFSDSTAMLGGPLLGGVLVLAIGPAAALAIDAGTFVIGALAMVPVRLRAMDAPPVRLQSVHRGMMDGLRRLLSNPLIARLIAINALLMLTAGGNSLFLYTHFGGTCGYGPELLGLLLTFQGFGMVATTVLATTFVSRLGVHRLVKLGLWGASIPTILAINTCGIHVLLPATFIVFGGVGLILYTVSFRTLIQSTVSASHVGRAFGFVNALGQLGVGASILIAGWLSDHLSTYQGWMAMAIATAMVGLLGAIILPSSAPEPLEHEATAS